MTRSIILLNLGINGDEDTLKEAKKRFENHQKGILIQPDLRLAVFVCVLVDADEKTFENFLEIFKTTLMEEEKMRLLNALCAVKSEHLIRKLLSFSISVLCIFFM